MIIFCHSVVRKSKPKCAIDFSDFFVLVTELSEVLWSMVLHLALTFEGFLGVIASFALFAFWAGQHFFCLLHCNLQVCFMVVCMP